MPMNFRLFQSPRRRTMLLASIAIAVILIAAITFLNLSGESPHDTAEKQIAITESYTVNHAAKLGIKVRPKDGTVYAAFYRTHDDITNTYLIHSKNGIKTFSDPVRVNQKKSDSAEVWYPVSLAFSPAGALYVAWAFKHQDVALPWAGVRDVKLAKSVDGGRSFGPAISPGPPLPKNGLSVERTFFDLAVSNRGTVFLSHLALGIRVTDGAAKYTSHATTRVFRSLNGGNSFDTFTLDDPICVCCHTKAAASPSGEVYFTWRSVNKATAGQGASAYHFEKGISQDVARDIAIARTLDGGIGNSYSKPQRVYAKHWFLNGCPSTGAGIGIDGQGGIHTAYFTGSDQAKAGIGYYYAYSDDKGETFTRLPLLTAGRIPLVHQGTSVAVDDKGNTWITFITPRLSDEKETQKMNYHGNQAMVYVYVVNSKEAIIAIDKFATDIVTQPVVASAHGTTVLAFAKGEGYKIYSLSLASEGDETKAA